jgi:hypothetical protein
MEGELQVPTKGRFNRNIEPKPEFTTRMAELRLAPYLSGSMVRRLLSKMIPPEIPLCDCRDVLTITNVTVILHYLSYMDIGFCPKNVFPDVVTQMSTRQQARRGH